METNATREALRCLRCQRVLAYLSGATVRQAATLTLQKGTLAEILERAAVRAHIMCPTCEDAPTHF